MQEMWTAMQKVDSNLTRKDFTQIWALSKQVVIREAEQALWYLRLKPVELYEFIARYAALTVMNEETLHRKVEKALDIILPTFGLERQVSQTGHESSESSESDY